MCLLPLQSEESLRFEDCFTDCRIWFEYEGSDHAPVWADLQLPEPLPRGAKTPSLDVSNRQSSSGDTQSLWLMAMVLKRDAIVRP